MEDFESCLSEVLLKLSESGLSFTLKREQELAMRHLFSCKDVMAVLPIGFGKSLIFQLFVMMCGARSKRNGEPGFSSIIVNSPLQSIIRDQVIGVNSMGMTACDLYENLDCLDDIHEGKFNIIYVSAEAALDKRFLNSLKAKDSLFNNFGGAYCRRKAYFRNLDWTDVSYSFNSLFILKMLYIDTHDKLIKCLGTIRIHFCFNTSNALLTLPNVSLSPIL